MIEIQKPPFLGLTEEDIAALSRRAVTRAFPKNTIILNEGDQTDSLYIIMSGRVKVFLANEEGKEIVLDTQGPGEYFGEMVLDEGPRSASVMTLEPCRFRLIPKDDVKALLQSHPEFAMHLVRKLIWRGRVLTEHVKSLALKNVYERFSKLLNELSVPEDGKRVLQDKLSQQEMANRIGASREMINRIIKDLTTGGYISVEGPRIVIHKPLPANW
jgi:CRP/FNR family cyclic AMP-dependent transcriptional regulator